MVGDGTYMMMNSDIYSSVLTGHKMIVVVCDNGGYAVINRLQNFKGGASFNNLIKDCKVKEPFSVDFAKHAESMGALTRQVESLAELGQALDWAKTTDRTTVITIVSDALHLDAGRRLWDVGVPQVSERESVREAAEASSRAARDSASASERVRRVSTASGDMISETGDRADRLVERRLPELGGDTTLENLPRREPARPASPASRPAASFRWTAVARPDPRGTRPQLASGWFSGAAARRADDRRRGKGPDGGADRDVQGSLGAACLVYAETTGDRSRTSGARRSPRGAAWPRTRSRPMAAS